MPQLITSVLELAQENEECREIGNDDYPNFLFKDPADVRCEHPTSTRYKPMELYDEETMLSLCRSLDLDQRRVLEVGVHFAKSVRKSSNRPSAESSQILFVVQ